MFIHLYIHACSFMFLYNSYRSRMHPCTHALGHYELSLVHSYYYFNLDTFSLVHSYTIRLASCTRIIMYIYHRESIYYPLEVRRGKYWGWGVLLLRYFPLVRIWKLLQFRDLHPNTPLGHHTDHCPLGLGQHNSLAEYCGPHTASSVFLILKYFKIS